MKFFVIPNPGERPETVYQTNIADMPFTIPAFIKKDRPQSILDLLIKPLIKRKIIPFLAPVTGIVKLRQLLIHHPYKIGFKILRRQPLCLIMTVKIF